MSQNLFPAPESPDDVNRAVPGWLCEVLQLACPEPPGLRTNGRQAASAAWGIVQLRRVRPQEGVSWTSVGDYLQRLAGLAALSLDPILQWASLRLDEPLDEFFVSAWGRLARTLGLDQPQAWLHLRLSLGEERGDNPEPPMLSMRLSSSSAVASLQLYEDFLAQLEAQWEESVRTRLRAFERLLQKSYQETAYQEEITP